MFLIVFLIKIMIKIYKTKILDCYELSFDNYSDKRGNFTKIFNNDFFYELNLNTVWKEEYITTSKKNVIRGMHFQLPPFDHEKMVIPLSGSVMDVIIDLRKKSDTYLEVVSIKLDSNKNNAMYIPKGCAHGFLSLEDHSSLLYKVTSVYNQEADSGILWSSIDFEWDIKTPILSERDKSFSKIENYNSPF